MESEAFEVLKEAELVELCQRDTLCRWVAQDFGSQVRAWRSSTGDTLAVACSDLFRQNRMAVSGDVTGISSLLISILPQLSSSYLIMGSTALIKGAVDLVDGLELTSTFGWMDRTDAVALPVTTGAAWLGPGHMHDVANLLDVAFPESFVRPGILGVERWGGVYVDGELAAVAACAWSAPRVGFIAGVAAHPSRRGTGAAAGAFSQVLRASLDRGAAALMVTAENVRAIRLYERFGMKYSSISVARLSTRALPHAAK